MAPHLPHAHHASSASSSSPKGARYAHTLDLARRLALFTARFPAVGKGELNSAAVGQQGAGSTGAGAGAGGMEWSEVLRKFRKHNPSRTVTAAAVQAEQLLYTLLAKSQPRTSPTTASPSTPPPLPPLVAPSDRPALVTALEALSSALQTTQGTSQVEADSARIVLAYGEYAVGRPDEARRVLHEAGPGVHALPGEQDGHEAYDLTLRVLASAVEGYILESAQEYAPAAAAYERASTLYSQALERLSRAPGGDKDDVSLHRIGAHALLRLCVLSHDASSPVSPATSQRAHAQYLERATTFSRAHLAFPAADRLWVHASLRALSRPSKGTAPSLDSALVVRAWRDEERLLRRETRLPPAGETNRPYLAFLDQCVRTWRERGARRDEAAEVVDILYAALSHTFQSHLLLRHLVRALSVLGRYDEAGKALRLYRELWDKARETDAKEVAREMRALREKARAQDEKRAEDGEKHGEKEQKGRNGDDDDNDPYASDIDSDGRFIETAVFGVRLLCRYLSGARAKEAVDLARRARAVLDEGRDEKLHGDKEIEANPDHRPAQHAEALQHLEAAVSLAPSSYLAHYSLAYQLLELRQVSRAVDVARTAVELCQRSREAWHLLALCVSAQKDMRGALEVLETALDLEGAPDGNEPDDDRWDRATDETERLAVEMQLRLSKNAVVEYLEGAASALADQQDALAFFSSAYPQISDLPAAPPAQKNPSSVPSSRPTTARLAPPVPSVADSEPTLQPSKAASLLGRRKSARRKSSVAPSDDSPSPSPAAAPEGSVNDSMANLSLSGDSTPVSASLAARPTPESNPRATKLLVDTWLASAASFRRAGKLDEAKGAIAEAEALDNDDPDVWVQLALLHLASGEVAQARDVLLKALSYAPQHVPASIVLARIYLLPSASSATSDAPPASASSPDAPYAAAPPPPPSHLTSPIPPPASPPTAVLQPPLAETLLSTLTAHGAWDAPEAWFELSRCYKAGEPPRRDKERECLVWALQLEETRPIRPLARAVERAL
ncbi:hypothetical protein Rhopal_004884-T1 [Rhodotorula paludigena]|uniref:TPR-like protein n=1 Tax=Rhodotorula paludigena TaxID=86838 RepID=A0AAV5GPK6_9BASI|nr:hypothetical protein Rhopal_004884-T1 [Rhodotorula paludigena]